MKVNECILGCSECRLRNGNVCDVCYKKIFGNKEGGKTDEKCRNIKSDEENVPQLECVFCG